MNDTKRVDQFTEFYNLASPLYPDLEETDFRGISQLFQKTIKEQPDKNLVARTREETHLKRTFFASPGQKKLYLSLKTKDIDGINKRLYQIQTDPELSKTFGIFTRIGLKHSKEANKHFKPLLCFDMTNSPKATLVAKISRLAHKKEVIKREMQHRSDHNSPLVPLLYHSHFYGKKHIEISELMHRDLFDIIAERAIYITDMDKKKILYQVARILSEIHVNMKVHGDVKTENIFIRIDNGDLVAKLGDFGHCNEHQDLTVEKGLGGTTCFWAPEVFEHLVDVKLYEKPIAPFDALDIWSLGWVAYRLTYSGEPYWTKDIEELIENYKNWTGRSDQSEERMHMSYRRYRSHLEAYVNNMKEPPKSKIMEYLIWRCWRLEPENRITAEEIAELLEPFQH